MKFKALVTVDVFVKGERTQFAPGDEVTGLSKVDIADLIASGSIEDIEATAAFDKKAEAADKKAAKEFADARKAVQDSQAAIEAV
jgi:hypothetical protein